MIARGGIFVAIEGVEGSGKSTQANRLARSLASLGLDVVLTHEPGGTQLGSDIRRTLLQLEVATSPLAELFLYLADRVQHVEEVIKPALERGAVVVCDRYSPSTIAYQAAGRGLDREVVEKLCALASGGIEPNLVVVVDVSPEAGLARMATEADRIEREPLDFHERVREDYLRQAARDPDRFVVVDGSRPADEVERTILEVVEERLGIFEDSGPEVHASGSEG